MVRCFTLAIASFSLFVLASCADRPSEFDPGEVESIDARLNDWQDRQQAAQASTDDPDKIEALVGVLRKGEPTKDHKCGDSGRLTLQGPGDRTWEVGILAGHNCRYYEFRVYRAQDRGYDIYRVEREPFVTAMAAIGLDRLDPGVCE
jgi:hypothetical protein